MRTIEPDLELGKRFVRRNPPPGELVFCAVSGAHLYGFPSPDSDLDLKGAHLAPTEEFLGLGLPPGAHNRFEVFEGTECDLTTLELGKVLALVLQGNGNVVEQILSPHQLEPGPLLEEVRALARGALSKKLYRHYNGFFRGMRREHDLTERPKAKTLLYSFRVALTGIHLLRTGEVLPHLPSLVELYGPPEIRDVLDLKTGGDEQSRPSGELDARLRQEWPRCQRALDDALSRSSLPDQSPNEVEIERWLVELRKAQL